MAEISQNQTAAPATHVSGTSPAPVLGILDEPSFAEALAQDLGGPMVEQTPPATKRKAPVATVESEESAEEMDEASEDEPEDQAETDEPETEEEDSATDEEDEDSEEEETEESEDDEDEAPRGLKNVPKGVWKRLQKQSAIIRDLKAQVAQGSVQVVPTAASPLADVESAAQLDERIALAKAVRNWVRENPEGGTVTLSNGATKEISAEEAQAKLARAEAELESAPDVRTRLQTRETMKPWEQAEVICPNLFKKGSEENKFYLEALRKCPELKTKLDNYEMFLAAAVRGIVQATEETQGKAKYVRMALDGKGKPIPPKSAPAKANPEAVKKAKPAEPTNGKPALKAASASNTPNLEELEARAAAGDETARRQLLRYELGAA